MSTAGKNAREKLLYDRARLGNKAVSGVLSQLAVVDLRVRHDPPLTTKHPQPLDHLRIGRELGLNGACPVERVPMVPVQAHSEGHIVTTRRRDHQLSVCRSAMRPSDARRDPRSSKRRSASRSATRRVGKCPTLRRRSVGQGDQRSILASVHPVGDPVGMSRHRTNAQDIRPERREDLQLAVDVTSPTRLASLLWCGECAGRGLCIGNCPGPVPAQGQNLWRSSTADNGSDRGPDAAHPAAAFVLFDSCDH